MQVKNSTGIRYLVYTITTELLSYRFFSRFSSHVLFFFCLFSIPFIIFALLSLSLHSRNSDPGSQSRLFSPLPTTVRAFIFIARRVQHFLPSSTRVEFCLPTLLSALGNNWCLSRKKPCVLAPGFELVTFNLSSFRGYH